MWWLLLIIPAVFLITIFFGAPYVPTHQRQLIKLFDYLKLTKEDVLVDLGSGDGRVLRLVAPIVKQAIGYELNPFLNLLAKIKNSNRKVKIIWRDFRHIELPEETTIVYCFPVKSIRKSIVKILKNHPKKIIFVSYGFEFPELGTGENRFGFWIYRL